MAEELLLDFHLGIRDIDFLLITSLLISFLGPSFAYRYFKIESVRLSDNYYSFHVLSAVVFSLKQRLNDSNTSLTIRQGA